MDGTIAGVGRQLGDCDICGAPRIAKGLCRKHYDQQRNPPKKRGQVVGEASPNAKLTAEIVRDARRLHAHGYTLRWLADRYKVSNVSIYNAVTKRTWKHVDD